LEIKYYILIIIYFRQNQRVRNETYLEKKWGEIEDEFEGVKLSLWNVNFKKTDSKINSKCDPPVTTKGQRNQKPSTPNIINCKINK
jgi:hypothetical protein